ncbi:hypothetical protein Vi05172_g7753 [Venturia inaequalis]|nr:hypothetical protein Vi05172_g7753 [Venturia inaequalis]
MTSEVIEGLERQPIEKYAVKSQEPPLIRRLYRSGIKTCGQLWVDLSHADKEEL